MSGLHNRVDRVLPCMPLTRVSPDVITELVPKLGIGEAGLKIVWSTVADNVEDGFFGVMLADGEYPVT